MAGGEVDGKKGIDGRVKEGSLTYSDYAAVDDGARYELSNGTLELMSPAPSPVHQLVTQHLEHLLDESCSEEFLFLVSPIDVILSDKEVRQPDIVGIRRDRLRMITSRGVEGTPNLVVEVVSPSSVKRDREQKLYAYALYRIPEYWIVTAEWSTLEQYVLVDQVYAPPRVYVGEEVVHSTVVSCAAFSMADVMRRIPHLPNV